MSMDNVIKTVHQSTGLVEAYSRNTGLRVGSMQHNLTDRASVIGMALAMYSRSSDTMSDILNTLSGRDASERIEQVAIGYGHSSVSGMAHTSLFIEGAPCLEQLLFFYRQRLVDGQGRSTRYQDYNNARYIAIPSIYGSAEVNKEYKQLMLSALSDMSRLNALTRQALSDRFKPSNKKEESSVLTRSMDCSRYLLPMGVKDGFGAVLSARELSKYISYLLGREDLGKYLGGLIKDLFTNHTNEHKAEVASLIRHTDPVSSDISTRLLDLDECKRLLLVIENYDPIDLDHLNSITHYVSEDPIVSLLNKAIMVRYPLTKNVEVFSNDDELDSIGHHIGMFYDHHEEMPEIFESKPIGVGFVSDLGVVKDLIRHRSFTRFVPLLETDYNILMDLDTNPRNCFQICSQLHTDGLDELRQIYIETLTNYYERLQAWVVRAKEVLNEPLLNYYTKCLLPHGHRTYMSLEGSIREWSYLLSLRSGHGGHINYRQLCYEISSTSPEVILRSKGLVRPDVNSSKEFYGRS